MKQLPVELPPSQADIEASRIIRRHATPIVERAGKALTFAADAKPLLLGAPIYWLSSRSLITSAMGSADCRSARSSKEWSRAHALTPPFAPPFRPSIESAVRSIVKSDVATS